MATNSSNVVRGIATADPTLTPGWKLKLHATLFRASSAESHGVAPLALFNGLMLSVSFRDGSYHETLGSAVPVGPGLAITAKHVLVDHMHELSTGEVSLVCEGSSEGGLLLWEVNYIKEVPETDLALLSMTLRCEIPVEGIGLAFLSTRMPEQGEELFLGGFRRVGAGQPISSNMLLPGDTWFSRGKVLDLFPRGRGRMIPGPVVVLDCPAKGGMSGGPVFDSRGYLVGVLSSSSEGVEMAYVSHIWPALLQPLPIAWPKHAGFPQEASLLQLGLRHAVSIERPDAFTPDVREGELVYNYHQWS